MNEEYVIVYLNFYIYIIIIIYLRKIWQKNEGFFFLRKTNTHVQGKRKGVLKKKDL